MISRAVVPLIFLALVLISASAYLPVFRGDSSAEIEFAVSAILLTLLFAVWIVVFLATKFSVRGKNDYWEISDRGDQVTPMALMIITALAVQIFVSEIMDSFGIITALSDTIIGLLTWLIVPFSFLAFRIVRFPRRAMSASIPTILFFGILATIVSGFLTYVGYASSESSIGLNVSASTVMGLVITIVFAGAEELVFRVLLLTALVATTGSRFRAVIYSALIFSVGHTPLALVDPLLNADWPTIQYAAQAHAPALITRMLSGLGLGIIWLRTGSVSLIIMLHVILNMGSVFAYGL